MFYVFLFLSFIMRYGTCSYVLFNIKCVCIYMCIFTYMFVYLHIVKCIYLTLYLYIYYWFPRRFRQYNLLKFWVVVFSEELRVMSLQLNNNPKLNHLKFSNLSVLIDNLNKFISFHENPLVLLSSIICNIREWALPRDRSRCFEIQFRFCNINMRTTCFADK